MSPADVDFQFTNLDNPNCRMCHRHRHCVRYQCYPRCCDGYEPDSLGRCQKRTSRLPCQNNGTFLWDERGNVKCECPSGFSGRTCEIPVCSCLNKGECIIQDGKPFCRCDEDNTGGRCEIALCPFDECRFGKCVKDGNNVACICPVSSLDRYKSCEANGFKDQSELCPDPSFVNFHSLSVCSAKDRQCPPGEVCCTNGEFDSCIVPNCTVEGDPDKVYSYGEFFRPEPCKRFQCDNNYHKNPRASCETIECKPLNCSDGKFPRTMPGECCPICSRRTLTGGTFYTDIHGCPPDKVLHYNTSGYTSYVQLTEDNTGFLANIADIHKTEVIFIPERVEHCRCYKKQPANVIATASLQTIGLFGGTEECHFQVIVDDVLAPTFTSCPNDIYIFDDELAVWEEPGYFDNVEVAHVKITGPISGEKLEVGNFTVEYHVEDHDRNIARCRFYIIVVARDTPQSQLPKGLMMRTYDVHHNDLVKLVIVALCVALPVLIFATMVIVCYRHYMDPGRLMLEGQQYQTDDVKETCEMDITAKDTVYKNNGHENNYNPEGAENNEEKY